MYHCLFDYSLLQAVKWHGNDDMNLVSVKILFSWLFAFHRLNASVPFYTETRRNEVAENMRFTLPPNK